MQILKPTEVKCLEQICSLTQKDLKNVMKKLLSKYFTSTVFTEDYLIGIGDIPIAIVAHMDTVFNEQPQGLFYDRQKNVMWASEGAGFDDRAGVYAIIRLLSKGLKPTIILTTDEESGAIGAAKLVDNIPEAPTKLKYIIQLDRRGAMDCVFYDCENDKFEKYVESFGFVTNWGSFSDISVICPVWGAAGVNLSIGYEQEHSVAEHLYVGHMLATIQKVEKMLLAADSAEEYKYICGYHWNKAYGYSEENWYDMRECVYCGYKDFDYNMIPVKSASYDKTFFVCPDCVASSKNINWCPKCGEAYFDINGLNDNKLCKDCEAKLNEYSNR